MPNQAPHRGTMLLVLSICGWLVCGILSPITWILAKGDLKRMAEGTMDSSGSGTTQTAKVIAIVHCILMIVSMVIVVIAVVFFAGFGFLAVQDAEQAAVDAVDSPVVEISPEEQLSRIIGDLGDAVKQQMQEGRQLAKPLQIEETGESAGKNPERSVIAFEYSFPIVLNGQTRENLSRHEGTLNYREGQWHLDRVAVSFKFFDTNKFSPSVDLLVEPVEQTPELQSLKTMWLSTVQQSLASLAEETDRAKEEQQESESKPDDADDGALKELGEQFVAELNKTGNPSGGFNIGHLKDRALYATTASSFNVKLSLERLKVGYLESELGLMVIKQFQGGSWVKCDLDRKYKLAGVTPATGKIQLKVSVKVESIQQIWPSKKEHKIMDEFRKVIEAQEKTWTGTVQAENDGGKWKLSESAQEWQKTFLESKERNWTKMKSSYTPKLNKLFK